MGAFVGAGTLVDGNNPSSLTPPLHASVAEGDLTVGCFQMDDEVGTWGAAPAGWAHVTGSPFKGGAGNGEINVAIVYRVQPATPEAPTLGQDQAGFASAVAVTASWSGNFTTPLDIVGTLFAPGTGGSPVGPIPGIGPVGSNAVVLCVGLHGDTSSGHTTLDDGSLTWAPAFHVSTSVGPDCSMWADYALPAGTPTVANQTFTVSGMDETKDNGGIMLSFVEAVVSVEPVDPYIDSTGDLKLPYPNDMVVTGTSPSVAATGSTTGAIAYTYDSITDNVVTFTPDTPPVYGETLTATLTNAADGLEEDASGDDAVEFTDLAIDNQSAVSAPSAPTISSLVIQTGGETAVINLSTDCELGTDGLTGLTLTADDGGADPITVTVNDISDADAWVVDLSRTVLAPPGGDSPVFNYSTSAEGIRTLDAGYGIALADITDQTLTNNSTQVEAVVVSSVPASIASLETGVAIDGSNFLAAQDDGTINISDGTNNADATVTDWSDSGGVITVPDIFAAQLKPGPITITVTNDLGGVGQIVTQLTVQADWASAVIGTPDTSGDEYFNEALGQPVPEAGDLVACQHVLHLQSDDSETAFAVVPDTDQNYRYAEDDDVPENDYQIRYRFFDDSDHTWGAEGIESIVVVSAPGFVSTSIDDTGTEFTVVFSEATTDAGNGLAALAITLSGGPVTLALQSGDGTTTHVFDITNRVVLDTEGDGLVVYPLTTDGFQAVSDDDDVIAFNGTVVNGSTESDVVAPLVTGMTINADSTLVQVAIDEPVQAGFDGFTGFTLDMSGGVVALTYVSGAGTSVLSFTPSRPVLGSETGDGDFVQPGDGVKDLFDNEMVTATGLTVDNQSDLSNTGLDLSALNPCRVNNAVGALLANLSDVRLTVFNAAGAVLFYSATHTTDASGYLADVPLPSVALGTPVYVTGQQVSSGFGFGPVVVPVSAL